MSAPTMTGDSSRMEYEAWRALCAQLLKAGAVTMADLRGSLNDRSTPGLEALALIREWGQLRVELAIEQICQEGDT